MHNRRPLLCVLLAMAALYAGACAAPPDRKSGSSDPTGEAAATASASVPDANPGGARPAGATARAAAAVAMATTEETDIQAGTREQVLGAMVTLERFANASAFRDLSETDRRTIEAAIHILQDDRWFGANARRYRIFRRYLEAGYPSGLFPAEFQKPPSGPECCARDFSCSITMDADGLGGEVAYSMALETAQATLVKNILDPQSWATAANPPFVESCYIRDTCQSSSGMDAPCASTSPSPGSPWQGALRETFDFDGKSFGKVYIHNILGIVTTTPAADHWHMDYSLCDGGSLALTIPQGPGGNTAGLMTQDLGHSDAKTSGSLVQFDGSKRVRFHYSVKNAIRRASGCLVERLWPVLAALAQDSATLFCQGSSSTAACDPDAVFSCGDSFKGTSAICNRFPAPADSGNDESLQ